MDTSEIKLKRNRSVRRYSRQIGKTFEELDGLLRLTVMRPGMVHEVADDEVDPWPPEAA